MPARHRPFTRIRFWLSVALLVAGTRLAAGAPPVDAHGRPLIQKLGTVACDQVENSPFVFRGRLYRLEARAIHLVDCESGKTIPLPLSGWGFANAFVDGDTVYLSATQDVSRERRKVRMWSSRDLNRWDTWIALDLPGYEMFNTSICKAERRFVMMFEIAKPVEEAGVPFTARFATSDDLKHWTVTPPDCVYAKDRYTAPHCLRFLDGYYYDFYLEALPGPHYEQCVVRSKDLVHWESSPLNPVLRASDEDRKIRNPAFTIAQRERIARATNVNNSDIDLCEHDGRLVIFYSWGNQTGIEHLAEAVYEGTLADFLRGWFPDRKAPGR